MRIPIWTALRAYLCVAITRHRHGLAPQISLTNFLQIVSIHSLAQFPLRELFANNVLKQKHHDQNNQMLLTYL